MAKVFVGFEAPQELSVPAKKHAACVARDYNFSMKGDIPVCFGVEMFILDDVDHFTRQLHRVLKRRQITPTSTEIALNYLETEWAIFFEAKSPHLQNAVTYLRNGLNNMGRSGLDIDVSPPRCYIADGLDTGQRALVMEAYALITYPKSATLNTVSVYVERDGVFQIESGYTLAP